MRLIRHLLFALTLASIIGVLTYTAVTKYVVHKAEENLHSIMLSHRSFHHYIQKVMHPTYYKAREDGKIVEDFYAPEILSSSFVARVMHGFFNEERKKEGLPLVYYKLAANNPRNPVNKADEKEAELIKLFNANRELKDHSEIATLDGQRHLVYAKPFLENNQACLRCHGKRKEAPIGLQNIYSGQGGFNESSGAIRAIESIRIPVNDDISAALVATTVSISAALILIVLYLFNLRLRQKVQQSTEALAASEENYRQFATLTSDYVHKCARKGDAPFRIQWIGGALSEIAGYSVDEMFERGCWLSIVHPDDKDLTVAALENLRPGDAREIIFRITTKDQRVRWISDKCRCERGVSDDELILYGAATDITEKKHAEELLKFTRETVNAVSDSIFWVTPDGRIVDVNEAACKNLGYTREELLHMHVADIDPNETCDTLPKQFPKLREHKTLHFESSHRAKDGRIFHVDIVTNYVRFREEELNCAIARDVTERKRAEAELAEANQKLIRSEAIHRTLFEQSPDGIILWNASDLKPVQFNTAAHTQLGYTAEEFATLTVANFDAAFSDHEITGVIEQLKSKKIASFESVHMTKGGEKHSVLVSLKLFDIAGKEMLLALHRDITEKKLIEEEKQNLEKQLLHAQKLESLGVLAGGIAHDFNNILMAIIGNADLALMRINKESPVADNLHNIEQAAARAADLAKQMLAYSGKGKFVIENLDLNKLFEDMLHMLEVSISKKAVLRLNLTPSLPSIVADATQMRQIIMNLIINASEAIGDRSGFISVTTGCMDCDRNYLKDVWLDDNLTDGLYVYFEVADTGCGMDKGTIAKVFDPFFTTKFTGRGLGMAAVLGIVRGHKGAIKVYSEPRKGTTFKVILPASSKPAEIFNGDTHHDEWKGSGTVLLVDDEETVRGIGKEMLKELGYDVITACDGRDALEQFSKNTDISCVILDLTMPHMDGEQCFRELRQLKPDLNVVMSSGFNEQEVTQKFVGKGLAGFIQKPYKLSVLKQALKNVALS